MVFTSVVLLLSISAALAQKDSYPYLYFYLADQEAFIVQRVDGTESYVLAEYALPAGHTEIVGAGWSPSGSWFSWMSQRSNGTGSNNVYVVDHEGQTIKALFDYNIEIEETIWSPTQDLLLVRHSPSFNTIIVYDASRDEFLIELQGQDLSENFAEVTLTTEWSPDSNQLMIHDHGSNTTRIISVFENREVRRFHSLGTQTINCDSRTGRLPHWMDAEHIVYITGDVSLLIAENIFTGASTSVDLPDMNIRFSDWSQDKQHVLLYTPSETSIYNIWIVNLESQETERITTNARLSTYCEPPFYKTSWNSNSGFFFVSETGQIFIVDADDNNILRVSVPTQGEIIDERDIVWVTDDSIEFIWYIPELIQTQVYKYSITLDEITPVELNTAGTASVISISSGGYQAYGNVVLNPITNEIFSTEIQWAEDFGPLGVIDVQWHPTENWMFLISSQINNLHLIALQDINGNVQRQLGLCSGRSITCYGWMPTQQP